MRKFKDYKDEEAIDLLADIIEPAYNIMSDETVRKAFKSEKKLISLAKTICTNHKKEVFEILAAMDGKKVEDYHCTFFTLPFRVLEILNNQELLDFFSSAAGMTASESSISAMENTADGTN